MLRSFAQDHGNAILKKTLKKRKLAIWQSYRGVICGFWSQVKKCVRSWHTKRLQFWATSTHSENIVFSEFLGHFRHRTRNLSIEHRISVVFDRMRHTLCSLSRSSGFTEHSDVHLESVFSLYITPSTAGRIGQSLRADQYRREILSCSWKRSSTFC